ncbi:MAG: VOC family protein [Desulfosarcina sp.]
MGNVGMVFDHVHLVSEDPESAGSWYEEKLGGKIVESAETGGSLSVRVAFEGATVIIRGKRTNEKPIKKPELQWGTDHFGFSVNGNFDAFCNDLKNNGVKFTIDPFNFTPAIRIAFIEAPDNVSIELLQRKV